MRLYRKLQNRNLFYFGKNYYNNNYKIDPTSSSECDEGVSVCRPTFGMFGGAAPICVARAGDAREEGIHEESRGLTNNQ